MSPQYEVTTIPTLFNGVGIIIHRLVKIIKDVIVIINITSIGLGKLFIILINKIKKEL